MQKSKRAAVLMLAWRLSNGGNVNKLERDHNKYVLYFTHKLLPAVAKRPQRKAMTWRYSWTAIGRRRNVFYKALANELYKCVTGIFVAAEKRRRLIDDQ